VIAMLDLTTAIPAGDVTLEGDLAVPDTARGIIVFAHGSGSSRLSPRNTAVAAYLRQTGSFGTLLFDLLTEAEDEVYARRFDITLLAKRLEIATDWLRGQTDTARFPIGYFGASTGAAAALVAAGRRDDVSAVVSRGGRPDLAGRHLGDVRAPTLLIVGGNDPQVIDLNAQARASLHGTVEMAIVPGATHLFEEPGALDQVARLTREWFEQYLQ
jgi:putative phosphoribosyl transferase